MRGARRRAGDEAGLAHLPPAKCTASSARRCDDATRGCDGAAVEAAAEAAAEAAVETGVSCGLGASAASEAEAAGVAAAAASHMCAAGPSGVVLGAEEDRHALMHTRCPGSGRAAAAWVRVADLR